MALNMFVEFTIEDQKDEDGEIEEASHKVFCQVLSYSESEGVENYWLKDCPVRSSWHKGLPFRACLTVYDESSALIFAAWRKADCMYDLDHIDCRVSGVSIIDRR
jgi:hypothetical protein